MAADYFAKPSVYWLLAGMALKDQQQVHALRKHQQGLVNDLPKVRLMTDSELGNVTQKSAAVTAQRLQMPPILHERPSAGQLIQEDARLAQCLLPQQRLMVIDIGLNASAHGQQRSCVAREADGSLRQATWEERDRLEQVYAPLPGRRARIPLMFTEAALLEQLLKKGQYEYVLERACLQLEPDDALFLSVTQRVYSAVAAEGDAGLAQLQCTRHFGPLCLHLIVWGKLNALLQTLLRNEQLTIVLRLLHLVKLVRPADGAAVKCLQKLAAPLPQVPGLTALVNLSKTNEAAVEAVSLLGQELVLSQASEMATLRAVLDLVKDSAASSELQLDSSAVESLAQSILNNLSSNTASAV